MQLYRIDGLNLATPEINRDFILEDFDSVIWTDRYSAHGDFELEMPVRSFLSPGTQGVNALQNSLTGSLMLIENEEIVRNEEDGEPRVKLSGRSIEAFLENRNSKTDGNRDNEVLTGLPSEIIYDLVDRYCVNPSGASNVFPALAVDGTDPSGQSTVTLSIERGNVYTMVKDICDAYGLGFEIEPSSSTDVLNFKVYRGVDRSDPDSFLYREYSEDLGNLKNVTRFASSKSYKTHARMLGATTGEDVFSYPESLATGFKRRTLVVDATDINADGSMTGTQERAALAERGEQILKEVENRLVSVVDGEAFSDISFGLGDLVVLKSVANTRTNSIITERILASDSGGTLFYPSFEPVQ